MYPPWKAERVFNRPRLRGLAPSAAVLVPSLVAALSIGAVGDASASARSVARSLTVSSTVTASTTPYAWRETAAPTPTLDARRRVWTARTLGFGTWDREDRLGSRDVLSTDDDAIYRVTAPRIAWYRHTVPAAGTYRLTLHFVEDYWRQPGQRVFDVSVEGRPLVRGLDLAARVGFGHAYTVTADVPVQDGRLDVAFTPRKGNAILSAVEVVGRVHAGGGTASLANGGQSASGRLVDFAATSPFYADVSGAPTAKNSAAIVANLTRQVRSYWGGTAALNAFSYNSAVYRVGARQPKVRVGFHDCQRKRYTPRGLYDGPKYFVDVPVPPNAVPARGTDAALTLYDPAADKLWEFWQMRKDSRGQWAACWGGRIDRVSSSIGVFANPYGASASGLATVAGAISLDEALRGRIDHALNLGVVEVGRFTAVSWPANRSDGGTTSPDAVVMGQRLRLDPKLDLSKYNLTPFGQMVARAAQKYGFIVTESAGAVGVSTESGVTTRGGKQVDRWSEILGGPAYQALRDFPWDKLQALPADYGKPATRG